MATWNKLMRTTRPHQPGTRGSTVPGNFCSAPIITNAASAAQPTAQVWFIWSVSISLVDMSTINRRNYSCPFAAFLPAQQIIQQRATGGLEQRVPEIAGVGILKSTTDVDGSHEARVAEIVLLAVEQVGAIHEVGRLAAGS